MRVWLAIVFAVVGMALTGVAETPFLRFGIASDVHILRDWSDPFTPGLTNQALHLEKALPLAVIEAVFGGSDLISYF